MPRIEVAVETIDGDLSVHNVGRPAALVAFGDTFGKSAPTSFKELAWLTHRVVAPDVKFDDWLAELEELTSNEEAVEHAKRQLRGDLSAVEQLEAMPAAELVALAGELAEGAVVDEGGELTGLEALLVRARVELEEAAAKEDEVQAATEAAVRLHALTDAERAAMPAGELERLQELAAKAPAGALEVLEQQAHPTTPAPATVGGAG